MESLTTKQKILVHPITRILLGLFICFITFILSQQLTSKILEFTPLNKEFRNLIKGAIASLAVISVYIIFYKKYEKREIHEFSKSNSIKNIFVGILLGALLQCLTVLVIYFFGGFEILSVNSFSSLILPFTVALTVAIFEEILIRGILFRIVEEKLGSYISLLISALIFGALHLMNANSTLISGLCIAVEAGLLLGLAYIYTRNLWFPISIHFAWNFTQSGIFGAITSGNEKTSSLLNTKITGGDLITGGEFGPEGTIQATVLCLCASLILLKLSQNNLRKPYWKKNNE